MFVRMKINLGFLVSGLILPTLPVFGQNQTDNDYNMLDNDPLMAKWTRLKDCDLVPSGLTDHSMISHNGNLYIYGGKDFNNNINRNLLMYSITNGSWLGFRGDSWPPGRYGHTAVVYNGSMYVFGGIKSAANSTTDTQMTNEVQILNLITYQWRTPNMTSSPQPKPTVWHGALLVNETEMYVMGGEHEYSDGSNWSFDELGNLVHRGHDDMWIFNLELEMWENANTTGSGPIYGNSRIDIKNRLYIYEEGSMYEFKEGEWNSVGPQLNKTFGSCLLVWNSYICFFGGAFITNDVIKEMDEFYCLDMDDNSRLSVLAAPGSSPVPPTRYDFTVSMVGTEAFIFGGRSENITLNDLHKVQLVY